MLGMTDDIDPLDPPDLAALPTIEDAPAVAPDPEPASHDDADDLGIEP